MSNSKLAILGGKPIRKKAFPAYPIIGKEEKAAVMAVLESGRLSTFAASAGQYFLGGKKIQEFEKCFAEYHNTKYAIAVNSATAGLHAALAAVGVCPGDEVIVPPYTFTATATSVLQHNAIPVFVDIDEQTFNIDPENIKKAITSCTKAIIPVHLLGHPADMDTIKQIASEYNLKIIEDCAQAPGAKYKDKLVGTIGALGVFSFQETKNIMTGEGGMIITNNEDFAERCRMLRNHGETIVEGKKREYLSNIVGWNYRMTELEAAIGIEQLKKLDKFNAIRVELSKYLSDNLKYFDGITIPYESPDVKHVYHVYGMKYDASKTGVPRDFFIKALNAEGVPIGSGYPRPLYMNPIFQDKKGYGIQGCPFSCTFYKGDVRYAEGLCPVAEDLCKNTALWLFVNRPPATIEDMKDIVRCFEKIFENIENNYLATKAQRHKERV